MTPRERRERDRFNYELAYLRDTVFRGEKRADALRAIVKRVFDDVQRDRCRELRRDAA